MAKKTLWQKIDRKLARLKIFQNSAKLICNSIQTNPITGRTSGVSLSYDFKCAAPESVAANLIDNSLVYAGDSRIVIDYLTMREMYEAMSPPVEWNESTGFIQSGNDEIQFGGVTYAVRNIVPEDWQNNQPGQYVVILKGVAPEVDV